LFLSGDINPRHSTQAVGSFFMIQMPLIIWGIIVSMKNKRLFPLLLLLLLAPVPAALTKATPHALRSLPLVIPLTIFSAIGTLKLKKPLIIVVSIILILEFSRYLFIYHHTYPQKQSLHWQYGYQQMIQYVNHNQDKYQKIFITRELGRPSIYYWFYSKTDPREIQILNDQVRKDQGEFLEFQNITFGSLPSLLPEKSLVVIGPTESIINKSHLLKEIYDLNDNLVFRIYET